MASGDVVFSQSVSLVGSDFEKTGNSGSGGDLYQWRAQLASGNDSVQVIKYTGYAKTLPPLDPSKTYTVTVTEA